MFSWWHGEELHESTCFTSKWEQYTLFSLTLPVGLVGSVGESRDAVMEEKLAVFLLFLFLIVCQLLPSLMDTSKVGELMVVSSSISELSCGGGSGGGDGDDGLPQLARLKWSPLPAGFLPFSQWWYWWDGGGEKWVAGHFFWINQGGGWRGDLALL